MVKNGEECIYMLFLGEYTGSFSGVGRLLLPKKMRDLLRGTTFVLTRGLNGCIAGYDSLEYENKAKELFQNSIFDNKELAEKRLHFSTTVYAEIDDQGRFVIPKHLLEYAKFEKDIVIVGVGDHFEIWSKSSWQKYSQI
jgi:MraZ protein